ncbi:MAG: helix-turn-helix domain-containing protein [Flavobacterium sp.]
MNALEIREGRKKLNLTQAQLAKKAGVSVKTISNYEKGAVIPESKMDLLHSLLSNNTLNEAAAEYHNPNIFRQKLIELQEKIKAREDYLLDLENIKPINLSKIEHQKEIINILKMRLDLMLSSNIEQQEDLENLPTPKEEEEN